MGHIQSESIEVEFDYKKAKLHVSQTDEYCDACGSEVIDAKTARENVRKIQKAKSIHDNLLTGEDILQFRKKHHITQKVASSLFGGGISAFAKYECDEIAHNTSMDKLLRLCSMYPHNISALAEIANIELNGKTVQSINAVSIDNITEFFKVSSQNLAFFKFQSEAHRHSPANENYFISDQHNIPTNLEFRKAIPA